MKKLFLLLFVVFWIAALNAQLAPPENPQVDETTGIFTWSPPSGGEMIELTQHANDPQNAYYQYFDYGYGVVYDLSAYTNVTLEQLDFRHSSWGVFGIWDYKLHIVDWDTYTELAVTEVIQTTGDDQWEEGIELGSIANDSLVGVFLEPLGNSPTDAYPCIDGDNNLDGTSYFGALANYSAFELSGVGDFLMDLWIMADGSRKLVKAQVLPARISKNQASRRPVNPVEFVSTSQNVNTRDFIGYNVYLDGVIVAEEITDTTFQFQGLVNGTTYVAGVSAVYDEGESEIVSVEFTYNSGSTDNEQENIITLLKGNFPNPFDHETQIQFCLKHSGKVKVDIYNIKGEKVKNLLNDNFDVGLHEINWTPANIANGVYFYRMQTDDYSCTKTMMFFK